MGESPELPTNEEEVITEEIYEEDMEDRMKSKSP